MDGQSSPDCFQVLPVACGPLVSPLVSEDVWSSGCGGFIGSQDTCGSQGAAAHPGLRKPHIMDVFFVVHVDDRILTSVDRFLKPFEVGGAR